MGVNASGEQVVHHPLLHRLILGNQGLRLLDQVVQVVESSDLGLICTLWKRVAISLLLVPSHHSSTLDCLYKKHNFSQYVRGDIEEMPSQ